jgi:hypothetical protein
MSIAAISTPIILWVVLVSSYAAYWGCIRHFEATLKKEDFRLWERLVLLHVGALRIAPRAIFFSFLLNGDFRSLNNIRISRAAFWTGVTAVMFGLSAGVVYWYYILFLPYKK